MSESEAYAEETSSPSEEESSEETYSESESHCATLTFLGEESLDSSVPPSLQLSPVAVSTLMSRVLPWKTLFEEQKILDTDEKKEAMKACDLSTCQGTYQINDIQQSVATANSIINMLIDDAEITEINELINIAWRNDQILVTVGALTAEEKIQRFVEMTRAAYSPFSPAHPERLRVMRDFNTTQVSKPQRVGNFERVIREAEEALNDPDVELTEEEMNRARNEIDQIRNQVNLDKGFLKYVADVQELLPQMLVGGTTALFLGTCLFVLSFLSVRILVVLAILFFVFDGTKRSISKQHITSSQQVDKAGVFGLASLCVFFYAIILGIYTVGVSIVVSFFNIIFFVWENKLWVLSYIGFLFGLRQFHKMSTGSGEMSLLKRLRQ